MIIRARRKTDGEPKMTPELTDRIVKVCERIGWPIMDNDDRFMVYYKDNIWADGGVSWIWQQIDTKEMNDCVFNVGSILGTHFRQWLESKYDRVLIEYTSGLPFKWRAECGIDGETTSRVRVAANDYLDLLLTAVEKTLEQENNSTTPSGMRPETAAYLQSVIEIHRKGYRHSRHAGWNEARADLAVEILKMEGVKHE